MFFLNNYPRFEIFTLGILCNYKNLRKIGEFFIVEDLKGSVRIWQFGKHTNVCRLLVGGNRERDRRIALASGRIIVVEFGRIVNYSQCTEMLTRSADV